MRIKIFYKTISFTLIFIAGWTLGQLLEDFAFIELSTEISVAEITDISVTLIVAYYVANYLEKRIQDKRSEKEIIISKIDNLDTALADFNALIIDNEGDLLYNKVVIRITRCRKGAFHLEEISKNRYIKLYKKFESLKNDINKLYNLCTYIPPSEDNYNNGISISQNIVKYRKDKIDEFDILLENIRNDIFNLKLEINNY